jgi:hypothetical protein
LSKEGVRGEVFGVDGRGPIDARFVDLGIIHVLFVEVPRVGGAEFAELGLSNRLTNLLYMYIYIYTSIYIYIYT